MSDVKLTGYHYSKDGKYPENILNYSPEKQKEILQGMASNGDDRGEDYVKRRKEKEKELLVKAKKLVDFVKVRHPLYFRVNKDVNGEWGGDGYTEYKIDKDLMEKATYTIGDSLKPSSKPRLFTFDEIRKRVGKDAEAVTVDLKGKDGKYIEGQIWVPYKLEGKTIVEDTDAKEEGESDVDEAKKEANSSEAFYEKLRADLRGEFEAIGQYQTHIDNAPEGKVKEKLKEIRDEEKVHAKELLELLNKKASEPLKIPMRNLREDYSIPSNDPTDTNKLTGYANTAERLLKEHKWTDNVKGHLEKELKFIQGRSDVASKQEALAMKQQELGLKQQELGLKHQEAVSKATINSMSAQAYRDKKEGDALVISANKGTQLPSRTQSQPAGEVQQGTNDKQVEKKAGALNYLADKTKTFLGNIGGRQKSLNKLYEERGLSSAMAQSHPDKFIRDISARHTQFVSDRINSVERDVRAARAQAVMGTGAAVAGYSAYGQDDYPKYASEIDGYTLVVNTNKGLPKDVLHAVETLPDGKLRKEKAKLIGAAAVALAAAGATAYYTSKLPPEVLNYTVHDKTRAELGKSIGSMLPYAGTFGGAYYAWRNKDNSTKRNIGLGIAGLSGVALGGQMLNSEVDHNVPKEALKQILPFTASATTTGLAVGYATHKAQSIEEKETIENAMRSDAPLHEVAEVVNKIREQKTLNSRYPLLRNVSLGPVRKLLNERFGKPAGALNGEDMAYYFQAQVDKEYQRMLRAYEATGSTPTQQAMTEMKAAAHDAVAKRVGLNGGYHV